MDVLEGQAPVTHRSPINRVAAKLEARKVVRQTRREAKAEAKAAKSEPKAALLHAVDAAAAPAAPVVATTERMVPISRDFAASSDGSITERVTVKAASTLATTATVADKVVDAVYPTTFLSALFESPERRQQRYNAQAIVTTIGLVARGAVFVARRVAK